MNIRAQKSYYKILMGLLMAIGMLLLVCVILMICLLVSANVKGTDKLPEEMVTEVHATDGTHQITPAPSISQKPLPETPDAGVAYQDQLIFVGDSLTAHMINRGVLTGGETTKQVWRTKTDTLNLNAEITSAKIIYPETGENLTVAEATAKAKPSVLIVTLGSEWGVAHLSEAQFKDCYKALILAIQAASPDTTVILQSIFPVTQGCVTLSNEKIDACNLWVKELAAMCDCPYLDTQSVLKGEDNALKPEYCFSSDGIHLTEEAYTVILQYIRTHAYTK